MRDSPAHQSRGPPLSAKVSWEQFVLRGNEQQRCFFPFIYFLKCACDSISPACVYLSEPQRNLFQVFASTVVLVLGTHGHIFVPPRPFMCFQNGPSSSTRGVLAAIERCRLRLLYSGRHVGKISGSNLWYGPTVYSVVLKPL
jgi:hypothetical protein